MVLRAPDAESASALAMLLWAQRVQTGTEPQGYITPLATPHNPSGRAGPPVEAARGEESVLGRPLSITQGVSAWLFPFSPEDGGSLTLRRAFDG